MSELHYRYAKVFKYSFKIYLNFLSELPLGFLIIFNLIKILLLTGVELIGGKKLDIYQF